MYHSHSRTPSDLSYTSDFSSTSTPINKSKNPAGLVFVSDYEPFFDLEDLLRASAKILSRETFRSVYAAKLDNETTVVVRRLKMVNISEQDFKKHMGIVGDVKHENVAALRAYYYSTDEKLMIYDYYSSGGSVSTLLHGKPEEHRANVDWEVRLRIAIGAARGISRIHTQNGGNLVHGNIKSSNIFLNSQQYGLVYDLGLASMTTTTFPQSSRCYAPEVKSTRNISQASDVYSFGILLLELLTRKSPDPSLGHKVVDLVNLVNSVSRKEWNKVINGDLLLNPSIREQLVRMLEIGKSCVTKSPTKRPKMSAVVQMIEAIGMMITRDEVSIQTERKKLVFIGDVNPTFDLEDLLRASAELLGKGIFGMSFKAILKNGMTLSLKRLKNVIVANREFEQHMKITGRMSHTNVVELTAYYYSLDEKLLVYNYYDQGSLSATLHGNRDSGKRPLDWNTRLNIALGAANGIAHIHTKNGKKLVHGNISASNILLDEQQYGIVSDVGLGKLISPTSFVTHNAGGYCAPEVTDNMKVSQASDVYSFGVVLLELLTAQPPQTTFYGEAISLVRWTQIVVMDGRATEVFDEEVSSFGDVDEAKLLVLRIARHCVASDPEARPKMAEVVKKLEDIRDSLGQIR